MPELSRFFRGKRSHHPFSAEMNLRTYLAAPDCDLILCRRVAGHGTEVDKLESEDDMAQACFNPTGAETVLPEWRSTKT